MTLSNAERQARYRAKREAELARLRNAAPTARMRPPRPAAAAAPPTPDAERQIKRLKALLAEVRAERNFLRQWSRKTEIPEKGGMNFRTHSAVMKALHPDYSPTKAERAEACSAFTEWSSSIKKAPSRGRSHD